MKHWLKHLLEKKMLYVCKINITTQLFVSCSFSLPSQYLVCCRAGWGSEGSYAARHRTRSPCRLAVSWTTSWAGMRCWPEKLVLNIYNVYNCACTSHPTSFRARAPLLLDCVPTPFSGSPCPAPYSAFHSAITTIRSMAWPNSSSGQRTLSTELSCWRR